MQPSSTLCRTREAHHHALAASSALENVRVVASAAAAAWAKEGLAASLREQRKLRTGSVAEAYAIQSEPPSAGIRELSENPDRGHADE